MVKNIKMDNQSQAKSKPTSRSSQMKGRPAKRPEELLVPPKEASRAEKKAVYEHNRRVRLRQEMSTNRQAVHKNLNLQSVDTTIIINLDDHEADVGHTIPKANPSPE